MQTAPAAARLAISRNRRTSLRAAQTAEVHRYNATMLLALSSSLAPALPGVGSPKKGLQLPVCAALSTALPLSTPCAYL